MDSVAFSLSVGHHACHFVSFITSSNNIIIIKIIKLNFFSILRYLIRKGADKDACTVENLRPIDLVEPDNYIALSFLISTSVNCNDRCL
jgi:hypothetical protein